MSYGSRKVFLIGLWLSLGVIAGGAGEIPLHRAAERGSCSELEKLVARGIDINAVDQYGSTPLQYAVIHKKVDAVRWLVDHGADVNIADGVRGCTPLFGVAGAKGELAQEIALILLGNGAHVNAVNFYGCTPLHLSVRYGLQDKVKLLIEHGADVSWPDKDGKTPLHIAAFFKPNNIEQFDLLLQAKADINARDNNRNETPFSVALEHGSHIMVAQLIKHGVDLSKDMFAAWYYAITTEIDKVEKVDLLLQANVDVNVKNRYDKNTPLHYAAEWDSSEIVKKFIDHRAELNAVNHQGETPLMRAAYNLCSRGDDHEQIGILTKAGADVTIRNLSGYTALTIAVSRINHLWKCDCSSFESIENKRTALKALMGSDDSISDENTLQEVKRSFEAFDRCQDALRKSVAVDSK